MSHCAFCEQPIEVSVAHEREGKEYCCAGCATADQMLHGQRELGPNPSTIDRYKHLVVAEEAEGLVRYHGNHTLWRVSLPDIHCTSCLIVLERMEEWLPGILEVRVDFSAKIASITFNPEKLSIALLAAWLDFIGYPPSLVPPAIRKTQAISTLGVAGFAMGNAMMSAFPEYFGLNEAAHHGLLLLFRYSTAVFATLSLAVAGKQYIVNAWKAIRVQQWSLDIPIAMGMMALWGWSVYALVRGEHGYFDSLSGLIFFLLLGKMLQERTYAAFSFERTVHDFLPLSVFSLERGSFIRIGQLFPGETITVPKNNVVPVNATARGVISIDYSFISGESEPVEVLIGQRVYMGGTVLSDGATFEVEETPKGAATQIWKDEQSGLTGWVSGSITAWFTISVLVLAMGGGVFWYFIAPQRALEIAVSVLIIACPCALSLAAPFAYGTAAAKLAQHNFYVKSGRVLASLASVQTLFWDKTGTLTRRGKKSSDTSLAKEDAAVLRGILDRSTHPVAQAMLEAIGDGDRLAPENWEEMVGSGIVARDGQGNVWRIGSGRWLHLTEGLTYVMRGDDILWQWEPQWTYRPLAPMFEQLKAEGKNLHLLSGDRPRKLPEGWERYFGSNQWFEQRPEDKMRRVAQVEHSMYLGDGLNDVEAMAAADVGVAVVEDVLGFFPKGNAVIFASALVGVPNFLRYARRMKNWVRGAYALSLTYNLIGLGFALSGALSPVVAAILMPLSSITVVLFSVLGAYLWAPRH